MRAPSTERKGSGRPMEKVSPSTHWSAFKVMVYCSSRSNAVSGLRSVASALPTERSRWKTSPSWVNSNITGRTEMQAASSEMSRGSRFSSSSSASSLPASSSSSASVSSSPSVGRSGSASGCWGSSAGGVSSPAAGSPPVSSGSTGSVASGSWVPAVSCSIGASLPVASSAHAEMVSVGTPQQVNTITNAMNTEPIRDARERSIYHPSIRKMNAKCLIMHSIRIIISCW